MLQGAEVTCTAGGRGQVYIGDSAGCVHGINRQLKLSTFVAHGQPVRSITAFDHTSIVITIAVSCLLLCVVCTTHGFVLGHVVNLLIT